jgi:hypothetical protein
VTPDPWKDTPQPPGRKEAAEAAKQMTLAQQLKKRPKAKARPGAASWGSDRG